jgi:hypothetical protein
MRRILEDAPVSVWFAIVIKAETGHGHERRDIHYPAVLEQTLTWSARPLAAGR